MNGGSILAEISVEDGHFRTQTGILCAALIVYVALISERSLD